MYLQHAEWRAHGNPRRYDREEAGPHHGVGQQEKRDERPPGLHEGIPLEALGAARHVFPAGPHHGVGQQEKRDERPPGLQVGSLRARVQRPKENSRPRRATGRIVVEKIISKWSSTRSRLKNSFGRFSWKYGSATYWRYSASLRSSSMIRSISAASSRKSK